MERIKMERIALAGIFAGSLLLSGCGSSSGSSSSDAQPTPGNPTTPEAPVTTQTVSGTAAIGAAITDGTVTAVCSDGSSLSLGNDAVDGSWSRGKISFCAAAKGFWVTRMPKRCFE